MRRSPSIVCGVAYIILLFCGAASAQIAYVAGGGSCKGGAGSSVTSNAINATGANFVAVSVADYYTVTPFVAPVDSLGNTLTCRTSYYNGSYGNSRTTICYAKGISPGAGYTVTYNNTHGSSYPAICVAAFSGVAPTSPYEVESGLAKANPSPISPGSVTPTVANSLFISANSGGGGSAYFQSIGSGFTSVGTAPATGNSFSTELAYLIGTGLTPQNPSSAWSSPSGLTAAIAVFSPPNNARRKIIVVQ